jgi:hypothetical protein
MYIMDGINSALHHERWQTNNMDHYDIKSPAVFSYSCYSIMDRNKALQLFHIASWMVLASLIKYIDSG